jgi:hypothetical protein
MESRYGFNSSRAGTALVVALSKTAPTLPVDSKTGAIDLQSSRFEHYLDRLPSFAEQLDGLENGDGQCLHAVLRHCRLHPRLPDDRVPQMHRAKASHVDRLLFEVMANGMADLWTRTIPLDLRTGQSAIALYRYIVSLNPGNPQGELKALRERVLQAGLSDGPLKPIKQLAHLCAQLREWDRHRIQLEAMSGVQS